MNYTSKQWRTVIQFADVGAGLAVVFILAVVAQHYLRFRALIFPLEAVLFLIPLPVLRAIAVKKKQKSEAREAAAK